MNSNIRAQAYLAADTLLDCVTANSINKDLENAISMEYGDHAEDIAGAKEGFLTILKGLKMRLKP